MFIFEGGNFFEKAEKVEKKDLPYIIVNFSKIVKKDPIETAKGISGGTLKSNVINDIDIVLPLEWKNEILNALKKENIEFVEKRNMVHVLFPYKDKHVQIDIVFTDNPDFMKFFMKSPKEENLKGVHKNILLAIIANYTDREESSEKDSHDRPKWVKRWKWSYKDGLVYIREESVEKNGKFLKKRKITVLKPGIKNPVEIAKILLGSDATPDDMKSIANILKKLKENRSHIYQKVIDEWKKALEKANLEIPHDLLETASVGATAAGAIATFAFPLFSKPIKRKMYGK